MNFYIDVGHGKTGTDSGASAKSGGYIYYENERNLRIARACKKYVEEHGHTVTLSRSENVDHDKYGSCGAADSNLVRSAYKCRDGEYDAMISIHCNDSTNTAARGFFTVWKTGDGVEEKSKTLCDGINSALSAYISPEGAKLPKNDSKTVLDNGKDHYGILRLHNKPGVLVEVGFMSNTRDLHELLCYYNQLGEALGKAFISVYGEVKVDDTLNKKEAEITALKVEITTLKTENETLKKENETLKTKVKAIKDYVVKA